LRNQGSNPDKVKGLFSISALLHVGLKANLVYYTMTKEGLMLKVKVAGA
jgi:hypothetical protein